VSTSSLVAAPCKCPLLSHQTLLWHHRLGDPSLPRLRGMHSRLLVSGLPRSLPPLLPSPAPPCLPCVEGRQRAAPHSSSFPPTTAPLQTLHMDVWGPAHVSGEDRERYFLLVVDDYTLRLQLRERFREDLLVLSLHSYRGGEFSSDLLWDFCHGEGILHSFTLPASPQQNGVAERRIGLVMEVARTSMIHAAAPHFLWPFAVRYAAHQLNLWPRVKVTVDSGAARGVRGIGVGVVGVRDTLHMDVWGPAHVSGEDRERYFLLVVDDYTLRLQLRERFREDLLVLSLHSYRGGEFSSDLLWDFCHGEGILHSFTLPASPQQNGVAERRIGLVMEVARTSMIHAAAPHFLWPFAVRYAAHQLNLWPRVKVTVDSGAARGAASRGAEPASAELGGAERASAERGGAEAEVTELGGADSEGAESGGVEPEGAEPGGTKPEGARPGVAKSEGAESRGAEPRGTAFAGGPAGASPRLSHRREPLSPQQLHEWFSQRTCLRSGAAGAGGSAA
ncbi:unnamed protein product, partial [Closterium sp. NIES-53]